MHYNEIYFAARSQWRAKWRIPFAFGWFFRLVFFVVVVSLFLLCCHLLFRYLNSFCAVDLVILVWVFYFRYFWLLSLSSFCLLFLCDNAPKKRQIHTNVHPKRERTTKKNRCEWVWMEKADKTENTFILMKLYLSSVSFFLSLCLRLCVCMWVDELVLVLGCLSSASFPFFFSEYFATIAFTLVFAVPLKLFLAVSLVSVCLCACEWSGKYNSHNSVCSKFTLSDCCKGVVRIFSVRFFIAAALYCIAISLKHMQTHKRQRAAGVREREWGK